MLRYFRKITGDAKDRGASAVEYGLMVAAIAAVIVAVVFGLGGLVRGTFIDTCTEIDTGAAAAAGQGTGPPRNRTPGGSMTRRSPAARSLPGRRPLRDSRRHCARDSMRDSMR